MHVVLLSLVHCRWRPIGFAAFWLAVCPPPGIAQPAFRAFWADAFHVGFRNAAEVDTLVGRAVAGNYNAVLAEVLAYHDNIGGGHGAYWNSAIVPKASDAAAGFDPLAYLCQKAHAAGVEVHVWLIPFRVSQSWPPSGNPLLAAHPEWLMVPEASRGAGPTPIQGDYTLDPSSPDVQEYVLSIVRELATNYPIDGVNWDRIRYAQTDAGFPASNSYTNSGLERFKRISGCANYNSSTSCATQWSDFRRRGIDELIRRCRAELPSIRTNPRQPLRHTADVIPWGNPPATCGGFSSTDAYKLNQNWAAWMQQGWLDAVILMNYKMEHCSGADSYRAWVDRTVGCWKYQRHVFIGVANYLNSFANTVTQMSYALTNGAIGTANYSYYGTRMLNPLTCDAGWSADTSWYTYVKANLFTAPAATPAMPWRNPATATEGTIWGPITAFSTGLPVDNATVQVAGAASVLTDGNGWYVVTLVPATTAGTSRSVQVSKSGLPSVSHPGAIVFAGEVVRYDFSMGAPAPQIGVAPSQIQRSVVIGNNLSAENFTVSSIGGNSRGPLNYTLEESSNWLTLSRTFGSTSGSDIITLTYQVAALPYGQHTAIINVRDAMALNSPQTVTVTVTVTPPIVPADFDADGDVDMQDFGHLQACLSGPAIPQTDPVCQNARLDADTDVDQNDLALFLACFSGANVPSNPACMP